MILARGINTQCVDLNKIIERTIDLHVLCSSNGQGQIDSLVSFFPDPYSVLLCITPLVILPVRAIRDTRISQKWRRDTEDPQDELLSLVSSTPVTHTLGRLA